MEGTFIELVWLVYKDGYTFQHWPSIVWMVVVNATLVMYGIVIWLEYRESRDLVKRARIRRRLNGTMLGLGSPWQG